MSTPIAQIDGRRLDLLVVGGGISGCAVAREAAREGLRVGLIERRDFGSGTSGRSSRLIHGGLRYLAAGRLSLVRRALHERWVLHQSLPHLVRPLPFILPLEPSASWRWRALATAGLAIYDRLARPPGAWPSSRSIPPEQAAALLPPETRFETGTRFLLYHDAVTDDRRLTLLVALAARSHGAWLGPRCELFGIEPEGPGSARATVRDTLTGEIARCSVRALVNATGPDVDRFRQKVGLPGTRPLVRPTRGAHLVVPAAAGAALIDQHPGDHRVVLAVPQAETLLLGTTDDDDRRPASRVQPTAGDIRYLEQMLEHRFPGLEPRTAFASLRPLVEGAGHPDRLSRGHKVFREKVAGIPCLTVAGGKLTTHRRVGRSVARAAAQVLGHGRLRAEPGQELERSGGENPQSLEASVVAAGHSPEQARWWVGLYGARWQRVLATGAAQPLTARGYPFEAEITWALQHEALRTLSDLLFRWRLPEWDPDAERTARRTLAVMTRIAGWSPVRSEREWKRWRTESRGIYALPG
ncbi:MAG: glycerol-3-phosphate dehydrogenase/oxidase [Acidobacteriota bacterium]|nr:glycerol-3-phosphate dehydrogenase/oxidase [Acidobacteriota bacterium]MDQ7087169.1 glycerol-3-phosphate dehydrogenase/oxidase [Acidobacteriota bacterium]